MNNVRIVFSKTGRAKYISHLDLMRTMQRACKRSKLPIWYTEGFHPHMYMTFPLPLSLGIESVCEIMDTRLTESIAFSSLKDQLNLALPEDLRIISVQEAIRKHTDISFAEYEILLKTPKAPFDSDNDPSVCNAFQHFYQQDHIWIEKKSHKKKNKNSNTAAVDIKPFITIVNINENGSETELLLRLPVGSSQNINPFVVIEKFSAFYKQEIQTVRIERTKILCENGEIFS